MRWGWKSPKQTIRLSEDARRLEHALKEWRWRKHVGADWRSAEREADEALEDLKRQHSRERAEELSRR